MARSVCGESNLTQYVSLLRKALSWHDWTKKTVENVPCRGYRFNAPVAIEQRPIWSKKSSSRSSLIAANR
jgi:DNA-binding winged helix-turn-helix (wHTH) protein